MLNSPRFYISFVLGEAVNLYLQYSCGHGVNHLLLFAPWPHISKAQCFCHTRFCHFLSLQPWDTSWSGDEKRKGGILGHLGRWQWPCISDKVMVMPLALYSELLVEVFRFSLMCESVVTCLGKIHDRWISELWMLIHSEQKATQYVVRKGLNKHSV